MKKIFFILACLIAMCQQTYAYDFSTVAPSGQTLYYNIVNGVAQVTYQTSTNPRYSNLSGTLVIPNSVTNGGTTYSVTSIGSDAFSHCSGLTSVTIPNSVTSIGSNAFSYCSGLTSVVISNSVTSIGGSAFLYCSGLTSVSIPNSVTFIGSSAFYHCSGLTSVTISNSVTSIGYGAFEYCSGLTAVTIPSSVTSIGSHAFHGCSGLISVTIPNSVISIGDYAFHYCSGLTSLTIPNSVTSIGSDAFAFCSGLISVSIGNSVTSIGEYAFYSCTALTSVTIPNTVTSIGSSAFHYVRHIEYYGSASGSPWGAFSMNGYAEGVFVYSDNTKTNLLAYIGTGGNATIPNSVISIGDNAFYNCSGLTSVSIPNSVTSIGSYAFYGCSGLTSLTIPNSVTSIGGSAFHSCSGLTSIAIGSSVTSIGSYAFYGCSGLTSVIIPNSVTSIGDHTLYNCSGLTSVTIGNSVTSIGDYAFHGCSGLTEITSLATVAPSLGSGVFSYVPSSIPIHIPCGSTSSYQSTWNNFSNFVAPYVPNIDVQTANSTMGAATITTQPTCYNNSTAVITTTANYGYHFTQWNDGNTQNPRTITLTQDTTFTAYFDRNEYQLTLNNASPTFGTVSGSGTYLYLDTAHIVADAIDHHHLVHWSDGDRNATRDIVISSDLQLVATFAIDTHTVTVVSNDIARGMVETTGTEFVYGTPCIVTATAYSGYTFARWSNGVTYNPYTFAVLEDTELIAIFEEEATQGIDDVANTDNIRIFSKYNRIIIDGLNGQDVTIYTIDGRTIASLPRATEHVAIPVTTTGVYIVKIGEHSARKVVVIR